jgi:hypothetical protein
MTNCQVRKDFFQMMAEVGGALRAGGSRTSCAPVSATAMCQRSFIRTNLKEIPWTCC